MFRHKMDPLVRKELDELRQLYNEQADQIKGLGEGLAACEQKLDELLKAAEEAPTRSIQTDKAEAESLGVMPGHIPWSQRKKNREQRSRSPRFVEKVMKAAAITEPNKAEADKE